MEAPTYQVSDAEVPALHQSLVDRLKSMGCIRTLSVYY